MYMYLCVDATITREEGKGRSQTDETVYEL